MPFDPLDRARIGALALTFPGHRSEACGPANMTQVIGRPRPGRAHGIDLTIWDPQPVPRGIRVPSCP